MGQVLTIIFILFCTLFLNPIAQSQEVKKPIPDKLLAWFQKYPQEKIYVHTSQTSVVAGDTLWYKIYATSFGMPTTISKVVYVQLIDKAGKMVAENKLLLNDGCANSNIDISSKLHAGIYSLRAFTSWMMNFDEAYLFHKDIHILNSKIKDNDSATEIIQNYLINFFPEGGDLIDSLTNKVAFKATDIKGLPINVYGAIKDNGKEIISFKSLHDGMGFFYLLPLLNHSYNAEVHFPDGSMKDFLLPALKQEGYILAVSKINTEDIEVVVACKTQGTVKKDNIILVASQNNGKVVSYNILLDKEGNVVTIPKKYFQTGIVLLTLFNTDNVPQAERVLFVNHHDALALQLNQDTVSFLPKAKSAFTLKLKNNTSIMPKGSYSISVIDADLKDSVSSNILSTLLLTSELKGYIHHPNYYFENNNDTTTQALDLVMLTNGWRRFSWQQILENKPQVLKYYPENSLNLLGKIINYNAANLKGKLPVSFLIQNTDSTKYIGYLEPDSAGKFILKDYNVYGNSIVYFNGVDEKKKNTKNPQVHFYTTSLDTSLIAPYVIAPEAPFLNTNAVKNILIQTAAHDLVTLNEVIVKASVSKTDSLAKIYVSSLFVTDRHYDIDLANNFYSSSIPIIEFMKGRFPGMIISGGRFTRYIFSYRGSAFGNLGSRDIPKPYFYLNEIPTTLDVIQDMPLSDVALIRFNPPPFFAAPLNGGSLGAICIYTKKGGTASDNSSLASEYKQYIFKGFTLSRQFFSPNYEQAANRDIKDNRTTLYWNPDILFNDKGTFHFSMFNSDHAKKYYVQVEGMSDDGRLLHYEKEIK